MAPIDWSDEYPGAITVCDAQGIILYMNRKAVKVLVGEGPSVIGKNVLDCHPEPARSKLAEMLKTQTPNSYTIEKKRHQKIDPSVALVSKRPVHGFRRIIHRDSVSDGAFCPSSQTDLIAPRIPSGDLQRD